MTAADTVNNIKKPIILYVSIFLITIPLSAQENPYYKLYLRYGIVVEGILESIDNEKILFRQKGDTSRYAQTAIPNSNIYLLVNPLGEILIQNFLYRNEFLQNYVGDQNDLEEYVISGKVVEVSLLSYLPVNTNIIWSIRFSTGKLNEDVQIIGLKEDSLKYVLSSTEYSIQLSEIKEIYPSGNLKSGNKFGEGMKIGVLTGLAIGIALDFVLLSQECEGVGCSAVGLLLIINTLILPAIGGVVGGITGLMIPNSINSDELISLQAMTLQEKNRIIYSILLVRD